MTQRISISFPSKDDASGTLTLVGANKSYPCLGKVRYRYPKDCTVGVADKENPHWSGEFQCDMPYAIRIDGTRGVYTHEDVTSDSGDLSHDETNGCTNLRIGDAKKVFDWVKGRTRIVISYSW